MPRSAPAWPATATAAWSSTTSSTNSDAFRRGLRYGDEVLSFAGRPISTANGFKNMLGIFPKGWRVPLSYRRDGKIYDILVRLAGVHGEAELAALLAGPTERGKRPDGGRPKKPAPKRDPEVPKPDKPRDQQPDGPQPEAPPEPGKAAAAPCPAADVGTGQATLHGSARLRQLLLQPAQSEPSLESPLQPRRRGGDERQVDDLGRPGFGGRIRDRAERKIRPDYAARRTGQG